MKHPIQFQFHGVTFTATLDDSKLDAMAAKAMRNSSCSAGEAGGALVVTCGKEMRGRLAALDHLAAEVSAALAKLVPKNYTVTLRRCGLHFRLGIRIENGATWSQRNLDICADGDTAGIVSRCMQERELRDLVAV